MLTYFNIFPGLRLSGPGYFCWVLIYAEQSAKCFIAEMQNISHLRLLDFINSNFLNIGSLIDPHNYLVKPWIFRFIHYGVNNLFILMYYF